MNKVKKGVRPCVIKDALMEIIDRMPENERETLLNVLIQEAEYLDSAYRKLKRSDFEQF